MENAEIIELWKEQSLTIEKSLIINQKLLKEVFTQKASKSLSGLKTIRWTGIVAGIVWCIGVAIVVFSSWFISSMAFKISLLINLGVTATAVGLYIHHLTLLHKFDNSQHVVEAQLQLTKLKQSNLRTLGILWIQLPVFSTWYMTSEWMKTSPSTFWGIQVPVVLIQAAVGVWLYANLHPKNAHKKWFKWFMSNGEFARIEKANELMAQIEDLKKE